MTTPSDLEQDSTINDYTISTDGEYWYVHEENIFYTASDSVTVEDSEELPSDFRFDSVLDASNVARNISEGINKSDKAPRIQQSSDEDNSSGSNNVDSIVSPNNEGGEDSEVVVETNSEENLDQEEPSSSEESDVVSPTGKKVPLSYFSRENSDSIFSDRLVKFIDNIRSDDNWSERYRVLIRNSKYAKGDLYDAFITISTILFGFGIVLATFIYYERGVLRFHEFLTEASIYGDYLAISAFIIFFSSIGVWYIRYIGESFFDKLYAPIRFIRGFIVSLYILSTILVLQAYYRGGLSGLSSLEQTIKQDIVNILSVLPNSSNIVDFLFNLGLGLSIYESGILIGSVGLIIGYPIIVRSVNRYIVTVGMSEQEFKEVTDLMKEDKYVETFNVPDYSLGESSDETDNQESLGDDLISLSPSVRDSPYSNYEEIDRYWVRKPYAYVSIVENEKQDDLRYIVVEPELTDEEKRILSEIKNRLDSLLLFEDVEEYNDNQKEVEEKRNKLENKVVEITDEYNIETDKRMFHRILYYIERDYIYYDKIDPIMNDPYVEDIHCNGYDKNIFVSHQREEMITNVSFSKEKLDSFIQELARRSGEHISAAEPQASASLPDGSRAELTLGREITTKGSSFVIRLFSDVNFTPIDLLNYDTFSKKQMAYLWLAIENNKSLIFAGGTASGKTTSMNAISMFIPPKAKVVTIEDTPEIELPIDNWLAGTTKEGQGEDSEDFDMYELLRSSLRWRPEYIIVGEIRGEEGRTLFQAMSTGHTTYSTMHAETAEAAINRLESDPINIPRSLMSSLDIICIQNRIEKEGEEGVIRRNEETREIVGLQDDNSFNTERPFTWNAGNDIFIESLEDSYIVDRISNEKGWSRDETIGEINQRAEILDYLIENDITEFNYVAKVIQAYATDPEEVMKQIENDTLDPERLENVTDLSFKENRGPKSSIKETVEDEQQKEPVTGGDSK